MNAYSLHNQAQAELVDVVVVAELPVGNVAVVDAYSGGKSGP